MRLICPSCATAYVVDDAVIGAQGRIVRCSNCNEEWFQIPNVGAASPTAHALEPMPIAPDTAASSEVEPAASPQPESGDAEEIYFDAKPLESAPAVETRHSRRREEERDELAASLADINRAPPKSGVAFWAGFATVALLALLAAGIYLKSPQLAEAAPAAAPALQSYAAFIDQGRLALAGLMG